MTTLVWTRSPATIAADRRITEDTLITRSRKLHRLKNHAIGICGDFANGAAFVDWWRKGKKDECPLDKKTEALVMDLETGKCWHWSMGGVPIPIEEAFVAVGSGAPIAFGALEWGATAKEAVETAMMRDSATGDGVTVIHKRRRRS